MVVIIKGHYTVKPASPTWSGSLDTSVLDQIGTVTHVPTVYLYKSLSERWLEPKDTVINSLKESLSKALVYFYPLAGRLHWIGNGRFEINCNAMGAIFIEAESDSTLHDLVMHNSFLSSDYQSIIPAVDYSVSLEKIPLLLVQLTKFQCGGISLSANISHAVADGQSGLHFLSEWARISRGEPIANVPSFDRKAFTAAAASPPCRLVDRLELNQHPPLLLGQTCNLEERKKNITVARLKLTKVQVDALKKVANQGKTNEASRSYTRYETVAGHVWRCACKARKHLYEQPTALGLCIDIRSRMQPPLPRSYFGNAILDIKATAISGDLVSQALGYACNKLREAIRKVTTDYVNSAIEFFTNQHDLSRFQDVETIESDIGPFYGNPNVAVVSWLTLPIYGLDFGWGREDYMEPVSDEYNRDGETLILPSPDGDGSLLVVIWLQEVHVEDFKKYFYEDVMKAFVRL